MGLFLGNDIYCRWYCSVNGIRCDWGFTTNIEMGIWPSLSESRECLRKIRAIVAENQRLEQELDCNDGWTLDNYPPSTELRLLVLIARNNHLKELDASRQLLDIDALLSQVKEILCVKILIIEVPNTPATLLHEIVDQVLRKGVSAAILVSTDKDKVVVVAGVTQGLGLDAGKWVHEVSLLVQGVVAGTMGEPRGVGRILQKYLRH